MITRKSIPRIISIFIASFLLAINFTFAPIAMSQVAITTLNTENETPIQSQYASGGNTYRYGQNGNALGNNLKLRGFNIGTSEEYDLLELVDQINIKRVDNPVVTGNRQLVFFQGLNPANNNIDLFATEADRSDPENDSIMKDVLLGDIINRGSDNIFGNQGDGSGNNNNIERVDFVATGGLSAPSAALSQIGFLILERGGNDAFKIAPITAIDGQGNPTAYGNVVSIGTNAWGSSGIQIATQVLRKDDADSFLTRTTGVGNQQISSIFFSYQSLGITDSQVFYGYSLVGGDVNVGTDPNNLLNIENQSFFPRNTSSTSGATGGLDLIASGGVFALSTLNTLDVEVTKESNVSEASPGQTITYTITVRNNDLSAIATNYRVIDNLPPELINAEWTCAPTGAADCNPSDSSSTTKTGTGSIDELVTIPPQQSVTYTVTATIGQNVQVGETISNTAQISPTGEQIDSISSNNTSNSDITIVPGTPNVLLEKRITAIGESIIGGNIDPDPKNDPDNQFWPEDFLIGEINGGEVQPGETVEYTIYFLSAGPAQANNVFVCDRIPDNMTFVPDSFGEGRGILLGFDGSETPLTNINDTDAGTYFPPDIEPTDSITNVKCGKRVNENDPPNYDAPNDTGAVVVKLGDLPPATAPGDPTTSYGYIRFRAKLN